MSIATVVTRGYGTFSTVNFLPTRGYSIGSVGPGGSTLYVQKMGVRQRAGFPLGFGSIVLFLYMVFYV